MGIMLRLAVGGVVFICTITLARADRPANTFTEFAGNPRLIETAAIVVDSLFTTDVGETLLGIYPADAKALLPALQYEVREGIADHGYKVAQFHINDGLFVSRELPMIQMEQGKPNGQSVDLPTYDRNPPAWVSGPLAGLMNDLWHYHYGRAGSTRGPLDIAVPDGLKKLQVDAVIVISLASRETSLFSRVTNAIVTGGMRNTVTGEYLMPGAKIMITVIDVRHDRVIWHDARQREGKGDVGGMAQLFSPLRQMIQLMPNRNSAKSEESVDPSESAKSTKPDDLTVAAVPAPSAESQLGTGRTFWQGRAWTWRDARRALDRGEITKDEYGKFRREHSLNYKRSIEQLEVDLRSKKLDKRTFEVQSLRVLWLYT